MVNPAKKLIAGLQNPRDRGDRRSQKKIDPRRKFSKLEKKKKKKKTISEKNENVNIS